MPPLVVADAAGTVYHFSNLVTHLTPGDRPGAVQLQTQFFLPDWIETRNGNRIVISDHGNGAFTVTDSIGRSTASTASFGASTDRISFSGVADYVVTWASQSRNRTFNAVVDTVPPGQPSGECGNSGPVSDSGSRSEIQQITLSNGQAYRFQYESK